VGEHRRPAEIFPALCLERRNRARQRANYLAQANGLIKIVRRHQFKPRIPVSFGCATAHSPSESVSRNQSGADGGQTSTFSPRPRKHQISKTKIDLPFPGPGWQSKLFNRLTVRQQRRPHSKPFVLQERAAKVVRMPSSSSYNEEVRACSRNLILQVVTICRLSLLPKSCSVSADG